MIRAARKRFLVVFATALTAIAVAAVAVAPAPGDQGASVAKQKQSKHKKKKKKKDTKARHSEVVFVGNNWDGTADILRFTPPTSQSSCRRRTGKGQGRSAATARKRKRGCGKRARKTARGKRRRGKAVTKQEPLELKRLGRINIIPDYQQRMAEIITSPVRLAYFLLIREAIGEGHDQFVDDMYSSKNGELLFVSRPSFADVVAIRISTGQIAWRFVVDGQRADHMAISPDGRHLAVSASTGNVVHIIDTASGKEAGRFESGDSPHENTYSKDGKRIYHASIGMVYTPADQPSLDTTKGKRYFQIVDAASNQIIRRVDIGQRLAEAGYPGMSSAVRPMAITADEHFAYLQVSFFHGFVEYDIPADKIRRVANLPNLVPDLPRELYLLDSAHHGIALNGKDTDLCVAGTMSDYAAIVSRSDFGDYKLLKLGQKPYWATSSADGKYCYVSWSGSDRISVISYAERREVARIGVGDHPQRIRTGELAAGALKSLSSP